MKYLILLLALVVVGCDNPYLAPNTSKATTELKQYKELVAQTKMLERIAIAIEELK